MDEIIGYNRIKGADTNIRKLGEHSQKCGERSQETNQQGGSGIDGTGVQFINYHITCETEVNVFTRYHARDPELLYEKTLPKSHRFVIRDYTKNDTAANPWADTFRAIDKVFKSWPVPDEYSVMMINKIIRKSRNMVQDVSPGKNVLTINVEVYVLLQDTYDLRKNEELEEQEPPMKTTRRATEEDGVCTICLEQLITSTDSGADDGTEFLDCSHGFHKRCISKWLQRGMTCPVCRCGVTTAVIDAILLWTDDFVNSLNQQQCSSSSVVHIHLPDE